MSGNGHSHWTNDTDLIDEYILDRVTAARREELESHLHECGSCRRIVERERTIIAGIRNSGRNGLKQRLAATTSHVSAVGFPWPRIASIAAVVLILLGIGVYNRWFITQKPVEEFLPNESRELNKVEQGPSTLATPQNTPSETPQLRRVAPGTSTTERRSTNKERSPSGNLATGHNKEKDAHEVSRSLLEEAPETLSERSKHVAMESSIISGASPIWLDGIEIGAQMADEEMQSAQANEQSAVLSKAALEGQAGSRIDSIPTPTIVVKQSLDLPAGTTPGLAGKDNVVHAALESGEGGTRLIVFPPPANSNTPPGTPSAFWVGQDSLMTIVQGRRILFVLPDGWNRVTPTARPKH